MCILSVYALLKVIGYYDLSVLSMSVMCSQKKVWMGLVFFGFLVILLSPLTKQLLWSGSWCREGA